jgi:geranylgeranyl pyrophosphate synthase
LQASKAVRRSDPLSALLERELGPSSRAALTPSAAGVPEPLWRRALLDAARDMLCRPGKEFRGRLTSTAYRLGGGTGAAPDALAAMLEILHAGSLIVDDIEDDSAVRRGRPTLHRLVGLPLALNTGNWMYFLPFALLDDLALPPATELELRRCMTRTLLDCHFGQALDLGARVSDVPQERLADVALTITTLKTGRLMSLAAAAGALVAGAPPSVAQALARFGESLGVGLQMLDDLGNLSDRAAPEKRLEDLRHGRVTWPWAWAAGLLEDDAFRGLLTMTPDSAAGRLRAVTGGHGRLQAHWLLDRALAELREQLGRPLPDLEADVARLEAAYA